MDPVLIEVVEVSIALHASGDGTVYTSQGKMAVNIHPSCATERIWNCIYKVDDLRLAAGLAAGRCKEPNQVDSINSAAFKRVYNYSKCGSKGSKYADALINQTARIKIRIRMYPSLLTCAACAVKDVQTPC